MRGKLFALGSAWSVALAVLSYVFSVGYRRCAACLHSRGRRGRFCEKTNLMAAAIVGENTHAQLALLLKPPRFEKSASDGAQFVVAAGSSLDSSGTHGTTATQQEANQHTSARPPPLPPPTFVFPFGNAACPPPPPRPARMPRSTAGGNDSVPPGEPQDPFALWETAGRKRPQSPAVAATAPQGATAEAASAATSGAMGIGGAVGSATAVSVLSTVDVLFSQWFLHKDLVRLLFREKWSSGPMGGAGGDPAVRACFFLSRPSVSSSLLVLPLFRFT